MLLDESLPDESIWGAATCSFELRPDEVHVWHVEPHPSEAFARRFSSFLSPEEQDRAARFSLERQRSGFLLARGAIRYLLGRYLDADPAGLEFRYGSHGKPLMRGGGIEFSVTRSSGLIACAFACRGDVGIDIERIRPVARTAEIAERFFTLEEQAEIGRSDSAARLHAFFRCWTRKEAFLKATGEGLPGLANPAAASHAWTVRDLEAPPGYVGAVVWSRRPAPVTVHRYNLALT